jgi:hypothetical protein
VSRPWPAIQAPTAAVHNADALERELAQLCLIGPTAGAELRRIVYGGQRGRKSPTDAQPLQDIAGVAPTIGEHPGATPNRRP